METLIKKKQGRSLKLKDNPLEKALFDYMRKNKINQTELAKKLNIPAIYVCRLVNSGTCRADLFSHICITLGFDVQKLTKQYANYFKKNKTMKVG